MSTITVVFTSWCVPFDQVVDSIWTYSNEQEAVEAINKASALWWKKNHGDDSLAAAQGENGEDAMPYEPIEELGHNMARYVLWGGEQGFHAMIMGHDYARLHEAHVAKLGFTPGYLVNAYVAGHKPGGMTEEEADKYERQQAQGLEEIKKFSNPN